MQEKSVLNRTPPQIKAHTHKLDSVKRNTSFALTQLKMNKEPKEEMTELRDSILEALDNNRMDNDKEFRDFSVEEGADSQFSQLSQSRIARVNTILSQ